MNTDKEKDVADANPGSKLGKSWWIIAAASALLPWISQPPLSIWPIGLIAIVPLLVAANARKVSRSRYAVLYLAVVVYWATTLQGLRYANPLIYPCWLALAAYLGIYPVLFVIALRRVLASRFGGRATWIWAAPALWVGMECVRNYFLTGLSAVMLGHTLADVPSMIQIADIGGSYAVSMIVVIANVAMYAIANPFIINRKSKLAVDGSGSNEDADVQGASTLGPSIPISLGVTVVVWCAAFGYGQFRLSQPNEEGGTTFALIGGNEAVEYAQARERELELFDAFARESIRAIESTEQTIDAVIWPESMLTGTIPWTIGEGGQSLKKETGLSIDEQRAMIEEYQRRFQFRASSLQSMMARNNGAEQRVPQLVGGCGVIDYGETPRAYSGIVHVDESGEVVNWYGKQHLVMFGEYIPLVGSLPMIRTWVPKNLGLATGEGAKRFDIGGRTLSPNICIETAVERVPINQLRELRARGPGESADIIITVTNDGWFDDSSVVQHHKRCAQLVAVACRRPLLSAANNGPTTWIDSNGRIVEELGQGEPGAVIARPSIDRRTSPLMLIGDWPARIVALLFVAVLIRRPKERTDPALA